jgi:hypothetical protein
MSSCTAQEASLASYTRAPGTRVRRLSVGSVTAARLALDVKVTQDAAWYVSLAILHTKFTKQRLNDFNVHA